MLARLSLSGDALGRIEVLCLPSGSDRPAILDLRYQFPETF